MQIRLLIFEQQNEYFKQSLKDNGFAKTPSKYCK